MPAETRPEGTGTSATSNGPAAHLQRLFILDERLFGENNKESSQTVIANAGINFGRGDPILRASEEEPLNLTKIIADLRTDVQNIDDAIIKLSRLAQSLAKGQARSPERRRPTPDLINALQDPAAPEKKRRGRPPGSRNKPKR